MEDFLDPRQLMLDLFLDVFLVILCQIDPVYLSILVTGLTTISNVNVLFSRLGLGRIVDGIFRVGWHSGVLSASDTYRSSRLDTTASPLA